MLANNVFAKFIRQGGDDPRNYEFNILSKRWGHIKSILLGDTIIPPFEIEMQTSSRCNLSCAWCIGENIQSMNEVTRLPNNIIPENVLKITQSIIDYKKGDLGIEVVKFSGFIGEPLVNKKATLMAMDHLNSNNIKVGLFSNGVLLADQEVQDTVINNDYVHISLDAGTAETFAFTKSKANYDFGKNNFELILKNISLLANLKRQKSANAAINVGFIINQYNYKEIYAISKKLKEIGADSIRFKCDIVDNHNFEVEQMKFISEQMYNAKKDLQCDKFDVIQIHSDDEIKNLQRCNFEKCYSHYLWGTVGSDGNIYPCDHTTFPGAPHYGNAINRSFKDIWEGPLRRQIVAGIPAVCHKICSPFALRINYFLNEIKKIMDEKGVEFVEKQREEYLSALKNSKEV